MNNGNGSGHDKIKMPIILSGCSPCNNKISLIVIIITLTPPGPLLFSGKKRLCNLRRWGQSPRSILAALRILPSSRACPRTRDRFRVRPCPRALVVHAYRSVTFRKDVAERRLFRLPAGRVMHVPRLCHQWALSDDNLVEGSRQTG